MAQPLLEGETFDVPRDYSRELADARREIAQLKRDLAHAHLDLEHAKTEAIRAVSSLRHVLTPLYQGLRQVFGEIDAIAPESPEPGISPVGASAVWDHWRQKLGKNCSRIIDALLTHGSLNTTQLAMVTGIDRSNVPKSIHVLNKASLINKNGGVFSLKVL